MGKAPVIGIAFMAIAWIMSKVAKANQDGLMMLCTVPFIILGLLIYFYQPKPAKPQPPVDNSRRKGEENLPQWVVNTRRQMERNSRQDYNWRNH